MRVIDLNNWDRKQHYDHFNRLADPFFGLVIPFDVTQAYKESKANGSSFFARYLHDCMCALNAIENFKYRTIDDQVVIYDRIHASPTMMRANKTIAFTWVEFNESLKLFAKNIESEKKRLLKSPDLFPPINGLDCIHCSAMPWFHFTGHKEPFSGISDSVPKLAFSKTSYVDNKYIMNVSITANHAFVDGYHVALFAEKFQNRLTLNI